MKDKNLPKIIIVSYAFTAVSACPYDIIVGMIIHLLSLPAQMILLYVMLIVLIVILFTMLFAIYAIVNDMVSYRKFGDK